MHCVMIAIEHSHKLGRKIILIYSVNLGHLLHRQSQIIIFALLGLRYSGSCKPFHDPQKFIFDLFRTTRYVIIDKH